MVVGMSGHFLCMKTMDASKVRRSFARVLEKVRGKSETIVIMRYGQPLAAIVPIGRLDTHERDLIEARSASESRSTTRRA
jgi:antitoxin (DNA-binding transcriptional repressor) of toxin-antitoxin stability system